MKRYQATFYITRTVTIQFDAKDDAAADEFCETVDSVEINEMGQRVNEVIDIVEVKEVV